MKRRTGSAIQYTIRRIPCELNCAQRLKAGQHGQSLNQFVVDELTGAAAMQSVKADFSDLVGKWTPDSAFDEVIASQRKINSSMWQGACSTD